MYDRRTLLCTLFVVDRARSPTLCSLVELHQVALGHAEERQEQEPGGLGFPAQCTSSAMVAIKCPSIRDVS